MRIRNAIVKRQALDRIMIGFNGVKRAKPPTVAKPAAAGCEQRLAAENP